MAIRSTTARALVRREELAKQMRLGYGYARDLEWYKDNYEMSKRNFEKDRNIIYTRWREELNKDFDEALVEILNKLSSDRELARDTYQVSAAIQAIKLEAQLRGMLSKPEVVVNNNTLNLSLEKLSVKELKELLNETDE